MSSLTTSGIAFACIFGGVILGKLLRAKLFEQHLSAESKDVVKLAMGLIGTMAALVLGLLIASAKSSFDTQRNGLAQMCAQVIYLDRILAHYGPEANEARETLRASVADMLNPTTEIEGQFAGLYEKIDVLVPKDDAQRRVQQLAMQTVAGTAQTRWLLYAEKGSSIPVPFLVVMVAWLTLILTGFRILAPSNSMVFATLLVCALAVASGIFLILELDRPLDGTIRISSEPVRNALAKLGR